MPVHGLHLGPYYSKICMISQFSERNFACYTKLPIINIVWNTRSDCKETRGLEG